MEKKLPASKLSDGFTRFPQITVNVSVADKDAVMKDTEVLAEKEKAEAELGDRGRVLLRKSGTEPVIRVMVEAESDEVCRTMANNIADLIRIKYEVN